MIKLSAHLCCRTCRRSSNSFCYAEAFPSHIRVGCIICGNMLSVKVPSDNEYDIGTYHLTTDSVSVNVMPTMSIMLSRE